MKYVKKFFLINLILLLGLSFFSTDIFGSQINREGLGFCCYSYGIDGGVDTRMVQDGCDSDEIELDIWPDNIFIPNKCAAWANKRLCYQESLGVNISTINGNQIYNDSKILNQVFPNIDKTKLIPYSSSCSGDSTTTPQINPNNPDDTQNPTNGNSGYGNNNDLGDLEINLNRSLEEENRLRNICSDSGGEFGWFSSLNSCSQITTSNSQNYCVFNPYLGGLFSTKFANDGADDVFFNFSYFEFPCIPKSIIKNCHELKTEDNCNSNEFSDLGCKWINSSEYSPSSFFSEREGICITDNDIVPSEDNYFDLKDYSFRKNVIKDSSFEESSHSIWSGLDNSNIKTSQTSYHGNNYYSLKSGSSISQKISYLKEQVQYSSFISLMSKNYTNQTKLQIEIKFYNSSNNQIGNTHTDFIPITSLYGNSEIFNGFFKYKDFNTIPIIPINTSYINYSLSVIGGGEINIDSVMLITNDPDKGPITSGYAYIPLEIIPSSASYCQLCYDDENLNFCTQEKSDLLGDCSYMVSSVNQSYNSSLDEDERFMGKVNTFAEDFMWESQSLPNSKLFCELYLNESSCINPNNFVNSKYSSLHKSLNGATLCKWIDDKGCFKDSDNNGFPDTRVVSNDLNAPFLRAAYSTQACQNNEPVCLANIFQSTDFYYNGNQDLLITTSYPTYTDFDLGCDMVPPNAYIYFSGINKSKVRNVLTTSDITNIHGNVNLIFDIRDNVDFESCKEHSITNNLFLDYEIINLSGSRQYIFRKIDGSNFNGQFNIKDVFKNSSGNSLISDGDNTFSIIVKDQSGNIGKNISFSFDVDVNGPVINFDNSIYTTDTVGTINGIMTKNDIFRFNVTDYSGVESCKFDLSDIYLSCDATGDCPSDLSTLYNRTGEINLTDIGNGYKSFNWNISEYIFNSSGSNSEIYKLNITCQDIFGQTSNWDSSFIIDFSTDLVLISEEIFRDKETRLGFFNSPFDLHLVSTEKDITSCSFGFNDGTTDSLTNSNNININSINSGFEIAEMNGITFYTNITYNDLSFSSNGLKSGNFSCTDNHGNIAKEPLLYYYDTQAPTMHNFSIEINENQNPKSTILDEDTGRYYTRTESVGNMKIYIDATGTFLDKNSINMSILNASGMPTVQGGINPTYSNFNITNITTDYDSFEISNHFPNQVLAGPGTYLFNGINTTDKNLKKMWYNLSFKDMANNSGSANIEYFYDKSTPSFNFSGDIAKADSQNRLFTGERDPEITLRFNTPSYREFECLIVGTASSQLNEFTTTSIGPSETNFGPSNSIVFSISDIDGDFDLENYPNLELTLTCTDQYNITLSDTYTFVYDITPPILNSISLESGIKDFYFISGNNIAYNDLIDTIIFDLNDTGELEYTCQYRYISPISRYNCNNTFRDVNFDTIIGTADDVNILTDDTSYTQSCYRNYPRNYPDNFDLTYQIEAKCADAIGLESQTLTLDINTHYVSNSLISFEFEYRNGQVYPVVTSMYPVSKIKILNSSDSSKPAMLEITSNSQVGSLYVYNSSVPLDLSSYPEGDLELWAFSMGTDDTEINHLVRTIFVDNQPPKVQINIPDIYENNDIYQKNFEIRFSVNDLSSDISRVELYSNNVRLFTSTNLSNFNKDYLLEPLSSNNYFSNSNNSYEGKVFFQNGTIGTSYRFEVKAYDKFENEGKANITVLIKDGIVIKLLNSSNAIVDPQGFSSWVSSNNAPIIKFRTTKIVDFCKVYPMKLNEEWYLLDGISNENDFIKVDNTNNFEFDLSTFSGFDMSRLYSISTDIRISCSYNNTLYDFTRELFVLNLLPDYVLSSSEGFIITDTPYTSQINVLSVGPYRYINCEYSFDTGSMISFDQSATDSFTQMLDFSALSSGEHILNLKCEDIVGNRGPDKEYKFIVDKSNQIIFSNVTLSSTNKVYSLDSSSSQNTIYLDDYNNLQLNFKLNKKNNINCSYNLFSDDNILDVVVNFFKRLFGSGKKDITINDIPYQFRATGLDFSDGQSTLSISCRSPDSAISEGNFQTSVIFMNDTLNINSNPSYD